MTYEVIIMPTASDDIRQLRKSEPQAYKKFKQLMVELKIHPTTGTGKPEQLKGDKRGLWSRRITDKHRLIYSIEDGILTVYVLSSAGHYTDK